jgi:glycosyltransferase involved in cell wall biosynthesis
LNAQPITVIIPAKDAATTIRTAVTSSLRGLPAGSRVIVRSDGSSDATADIVRSLGDTRVEVVEGAEAIGVAASLNELLERVETPLVARMDADDIVLPGRWRSQLAAIDRGADFVFTPVINWFSGTPLFKPQWPEAVSPEVSRLLLLVDNPFMHPTMLAKTAAMRTLDGYRAVPSEDYELWLRAATADYRLARTARAYLLYRRHPGQVTAQTSWRAKRAATTIVEESFLELGEKVLGFRPSWFAWRRDGLPADSIPDGVLGELDALERLADGMTSREKRPLLRRIAQLRNAASEG